MAFASDKTSSRNTQQYLAPRVTQLTLAEAKAKLLAYTGPGDLDGDEMLAKLEQLIKIQIEIENESKSRESMHGNQGER